MTERRDESPEQELFIRLLKLFISLNFFFLSAVGAALSGLVGRKTGGRCIILYYHEILAEHRIHFARQMDILLRRAKPVSLERRESLEVGGRYAAVTFDDGFISVAEQALPELVQRKIPATIFVTSDLLGQTPRWNGYRGRFMSVDELRRLPGDLISLGSHSRTHAFLPDLREDEARSEIVHSQIKLSKLLEREITLFSFPYGAFNDRLIAMCHEAGYERVVSTLPYPARLGSEEFLSGRVWVEPTDWPIEFYLKLSGAYRWLPVAFTAKRNVKAIVTRLAAREVSLQSGPR